MRCSAPLFRRVLPVFATALGLGALWPGATNASGRPDRSSPRPVTNGHSHVGRVRTAGVWLRVRQEPTTHSQEIAVLRPCSTVSVLGTVEGQTVAGTPLWFRLEGRPGWISAAYARVLRPDVVEDDSSVAAMP
ncbi:SH3 domain-containing protein [Streptomyces sp. NPDC050095]|uniref:SH3 domain-containing protein n=1 Tax=unclassified Streptomyces TaxID=2593676 RepID=UPI00342AA974